MNYQKVNAKPIQVPEIVEYKKRIDERQKIADLVSEYVSPALLQHLLAVEVVMYELAHHFGESEKAEEWALSGLIHDIDWDACGKNGDLHCSEQTEKWLLEKGVTNEIVENAFSHYGFIKVGEQKVGFESGGTGIEADTLLRKTLFAADELTGFIIACSLVRPTKTIADMETKSVMKKLKDKSFAAQIDRELIKTCEQTLGLELREFVDLVLQKMKKHQPQLESLSK
jgi:predicted hydrolase (HD superfamily)